MWHFNSTELKNGVLPLLKTVLLRNVPWLAANWSHPQSGQEDLCRLYPVYSTALTVGTFVLRFHCGHNA